VSAYPFGIVTSKLGSENVPPDVTATTADNGPAASVLVPSTAAQWLALPEAVTLPPVTAADEHLRPPVAAAGAPKHPPAPMLLLPRLTAVVFAKAPTAGSDEQMWNVVAASSVVSALSQQSV
jgi:hypothetical protein